MACIGLADFSIPIEHFLHLKCSIISWADHIEEEERYPYNKSKICYNFDMCSISCIYGKKVYYILKCRQRCTFTVINKIFYYKYKTEKSCEFTYYLCLHKCFNKQVTEISIFYMDAENKKIHDRMKYVAYMSGANIPNISDMNLSNEEKYIHSIAKTAINCEYCQRLNKVCRRHIDKMKIVLNFYQKNNLLNEIMLRV